MSICYSIQFFYLLFQDLKEVEDLLKKLKNNTQGQNDTITERLKNITMEAENMAKDVETKMKQIEGMMVFFIIAISQQSDWISRLPWLKMYSNCLLILCFVLQLISVLEKRIQNALQNKMNKTKELEDLLVEAMSLQEYIAEKVSNYSQCAT